MNKKGQITVIIIIVVLMLIIFGAVTYITGRAQEEKGEEMIRQQILSQAKIQPIQEFVSSCLDLAAKEALEVLGKQGGNLYISQGGLMPDQNKVDLGKTYLIYDGYDLPFAVTKPRGKFAIFDSELPQYPFQGFPWVALPDGGKVRYFEGFYGFTHLIKLLKPHTLSLQEQMEEYVKNNVVACADWSTFTVQNLEITSEEPVVNVTITDKAIFYDMIFPIAITDLATDATADLLDFSISYNVRLKHILQFLDWVTENEVANMSFKIEDATIKDVRTDVLRNVDGSHDDVVIIRDAASTILGQPFEFRFGVQNRPPALGILNMSDENFEANLSTFVFCGITGGEGPTVSLSDTELVLVNPVGCAFERPFLQIPIEGYDPDDDDLQYLMDILTQTGIATTTLMAEDLPRGGAAIVFTVKVKDGQYEDVEELRFSTAIYTPE